MPAGETAHSQSSFTHAAGTVAVAMIYVSGIGWALGWNSTQYLINAEIFPLRVRSLGSSLVMTFHFVSQYGKSKAVPQMLLQATWKPRGTFWSFLAVTVVGLGWVWLFLPETAGRSLEAMNEMFALPWHMVGRKAAKTTAGQESIAETCARSDMEDLEVIEFQFEHERKTKCLSCEMMVYHHEETKACQRVCKYLVRWS